VPALSPAEGCPASYPPDHGLLPLPASSLFLPLPPAAAACRLPPPPPPPLTPPTVHRPPTTASSLCRCRLPPPLPLAPRPSRQAGGFRCCFPLDNPGGGGRILGRVRGAYWEVPLWSPYPGARAGLVARPLWPRVWPQASCWLGSCCGPGCGGRRPRHRPAYACFAPCLNPSSCRPGRRRRRRPQSSPLRQRPCRRRLQRRAGLRWREGEKRCGSQPTTPLRGRASGRCPA